MSRYGSTGFACISNAVQLYFTCGCWHIRKVPMQCSPEFFVDRLRTIVLIKDDRLIELDDLAHFSHKRDATRFEPLSGRLVAVWCRSSASRD